MAAVCRRAAPPRFWFVVRLQCEMRSRLPFSEAASVAIVRQAAVVLTSGSGWRTIGRSHHPRPLELVMPLELHIIRAHEFIQMGAHGHFDLPASKLALAQLARACRKRNINQALMDLRALRPGPKPVFSPADLAELVNTFREIGFTQHQRLAVLYHSDPHHRARLFAFLSSMHGWNVKAFGDFEKALLWLSSGPATEAKRARAPGEKLIPLRTTHDGAGAIAPAPAPRKSGAGLRKPLPRPARSAKSHAPSVTLRGR